MKSVMNYSVAKAPTVTSARSSFDLSSGAKTTIDFDYIYPHYLLEVLPGDTITINPTIFARLATPLYPVMDNSTLDILWFYAPMRLLWDNSRKFFGEQINPGDSIAYTVPTMAATATTGYGELSLFDYFGLPTKIPDYTHSALPIRMYQMVYKEWFRDQNLINSPTISTADGPDTTTTTSLQKRGKRHDYFTSGLTSPQKGDAVDLPLGTQAPITGIGLRYPDATSTWAYRETPDVDIASGTGWAVMDVATYPITTGQTHLVVEQSSTAGYPNIYADLSSATAATIIQLREAMAIQALLELDARAGTRYNEIVYSTFGVTMIDVTYKPEFLGSGTARIGIQQVPSTYDDNTQNTKGSLGAYGTATLQNGGFTKSFTEHGYILGVINAKSDLTYQQGLERHWTRSTRYDYFYPQLQGIGDQATLVKELYCQDPATDTGSTGTPDNERVFNYQERYAEYKYKPSQITGLFRSNCTSSLEAWHLSQEFTSLPTFNQTFIESNTPMDRAIVTTSEPHLIIDSYFQVNAVRPMQMYSIPGMGMRF